MISDTNNWFEQLEQLVSENGGDFDDLDSVVKERVLFLFGKITDEGNKNTNNLSNWNSLTPEQKKYQISHGLFLYAQTYVKIVQSVTRHHIGWMDCELNGHYQHTVKSIKHLLSLDECKDFPGDFEPINDNIFPESGILDLGWDVLAESCVDFLSRTQQFCVDTPAPSGDTSFYEVYFEWLKSRHELILKKAEEYDNKAKQMWRNFEQKHFGKEKASNISPNGKKQPSGSTPLNWKDTKDKERVIKLVDLEVGKGKTISSAIRGVIQDTNLQHATFQAIRGEFGRKKKRK